jgi:hypothetical protein
MRSRRWSFREVPTVGWTSPSAHRRRVRSRLWGCERHRLPRRTVRPPSPFSVARRGETYRRNRTGSFHLVSCAGGVRRGSGVRWRGGKASEKHDDRGPAFRWEQDEQPRRKARLQAAHSGWELGRRAASRQKEAARVSARTAMIKDDKSDAVRWSMDGVLSVPVPPRRRGIGAVPTVGWTSPSAHRRRVRSRLWGCERHRLPRRTVRPPSPFSVARRGETYRRNRTGSCVSLHVPSLERVADRHRMGYGEARALRCPHALRHPPLRYQAPPTAPGRRARRTAGDGRRGRLPAPLASSLRGVPAMARGE